VLEVEIQKTAQSKEQLGFVPEENRSLRKALLKQHRPYFARLDYLLLGQKARSLEPAAERFRQAAQATSTQNNNSLRRTLELLFAEATPCNLDALESTLFFAIFDVPFTRERLESGLGIQPVFEELEKAYHEWLERDGTLEQVYHNLRPREAAVSFRAVDELISRLAGIASVEIAKTRAQTSQTAGPQQLAVQREIEEGRKEVVANPKSSPLDRRFAASKDERQALVQQLQRFLRLAAEPVRINAYLHAKLEEIEGALGTGIPDRVAKSLFKHAEKALYHDEAALRKLNETAPEQVLARLQPILDHWFREEALPFVQQTLYQSPFSAYWFFVQSGMVARRPVAFKGAQVQVGPEVSDLESLKKLSLHEVLSRLKRQRLPSDFVDAYLVLERALTEVTLSRDEALRQIDSAQLSHSDRARLHRYVAAKGQTETLSTLDAYSWMIRDSSKFKGSVDWELLAAALHMLQQAKREKMQQEIARLLQSRQHPQLALYLQTAGELMLELESRQARERRFQESTGGGPIGWILSHFVIGGGVPVQLWAPGGVSGDRFAELVNEISPKNAKSGNCYLGKAATDIRLLHDGREYHEGMIEVIDAARNFLNISSFDWRVDLGGKEIAYRLMAKKLGMEGEAYQRFLTYFHKGVRLDRRATTPTLFYDIPPSRMKNLLVYFLITTSESPAIVGVRAQLQEVLGESLSCPNLATCGDLARAYQQAGGKFNPQRSSEPGYGKTWRAFQELQALFEEKTPDLRTTRPLPALADYVANSHRLRTFVRRHGRKREDDPARPFPINIITDAKQNLFNVHLGQPSTAFPYFFSDPVRDLYRPLFEFDVQLLLWKGLVEFPWHLGPIPLAGRKIAGVAPFPYVPFPWLRFVPGFGWAGLGSSLLLQHVLATDVRTWWSMAMHSKNISSESAATESGMGLGTKYFNLYPEFQTWHDMGVKVEGPIVGDVNDHFVQVYNEARVNNTGIPGSRGVKIPSLRYEDYRYSGASIEGFRSWLITTHPEEGDYNYRGLFMAALAAARENIYIENSFFSDPLVAHMLLRKAREFRGRVNCADLNEKDCSEKKREAVKIYLVLPDSSDKPIIDALGTADWHDMLHLGVKVYRWNPPRGWSATKMLHTKAWLIDYRDGAPGLAYVGSANATQRSHLTDNEVGIVSTSPDFAKQVYERLFLPDLTTDGRLESMGNFHIVWSTNSLVRSSHWLRNWLVSLLWFF